MTHALAQPPSADAPDQKAAAGQEGAGAMRAAAWAAVVLGAAFQLWHFFGARPFWLDEAMLALNLRHLSMAELMGHLDYEQIAPIGWLVIEKLLAGLPLAPEYALRLPSLAAGIGALLLFPGLASRLLGRWGALGAVILFSTSITLVRYAAEVKPYEVDLFLCVAVLAMGAAILPRAKASPALVAGLGTLGVAGIFVSLPVVFALGGVGATLFLRRAVQRRWGEAAALAVIGAAWIAIFAALLIWHYQPITAAAGVRSGGADHYFERAAYAPLPPTSLADLRWFLSWGTSLVEFLVAGEARIPTSLTMLAGLAFLLRRRPWMAALVCAPGLVALIGSAAHAYPLFDRLALFLLPCLFLLVGAGLDWVATTARPPIIPWGVLLVLTIAGQVPNLQGALRTQPPFAVQNLLPSLEVLRDQARPDEPIYVSNMGVPAYLYYRKAYGLGARPWIEGAGRPDLWLCLPGELPAGTQPRRLWILNLVVSEEPAEPTEAFDLALARANLAGELKLRAQTYNVRLYSLDLAPLSLAGHAGPPPKTCQAPITLAFDPPARIAARAR